MNIRNAKKIALALAREHVSAAIGSGVGIARRLVAAAKGEEDWNLRENRSDVPVGEGDASEVEYIPFELFGDDVGAEIVAPLHKAISDAITRATTIGFAVGLDHVVEHVVDLVDDAVTKQHEKADDALDKADFKNIGDFQQRLVLDALGLAHQAVLSVVDAEIIARAEILTRMMPGSRQAKDAVEEAAAVLVRGMISADRVRYTGTMFAKLNQAIGATDSLAHPGGKLGKILD